MSHAAYTFNRFHLGDNLVFLHLLRALAKQRVSTPFVHFCHGQGIPQLREAVADLSNIILEPFESPLWQEHEHEAVDTWKNSGGAWESSPLRWDWSAYTLWHHGSVARSMGMESPFTCREHLLFDYPALQSGSLANDIPELIVVDAEPCSGQFGPMRQHGTGCLDQLVALLKNAGHSVRTTNECKRNGLTVTEIAYLSRNSHVLGVMSGPMWPCINVHRHHDSKLRTLALLDNGEVLGLPRVEQCANMDELMKIAEEAHWI